MREALLPTTIIYINNGNQRLFQCTRDIHHATLRRPRSSPFQSVHCLDVKMYVSALRKRVMQAL